MTEGIQVVATREFNGVTLNCYQEAGQIDPTEFWATREQIGQALEYSNPRIAIANIHERNKERLDKYSTVIRMSTVEGDRTVTREVIMYNFKGLLEICRYSQQPKANAVIDLLWDIADEIRRTGSYGHIELNSLNVRAAEVLKNTVQYLSASSEKQAFTREIYRLVTGQELPKNKPEQPKHTPRHWTVQQVAKSMKWQPEAVMHRAEALGLTKEDRYGYFDGDTWYFSKEGRQKFMEYVSSGIVKIEGGYKYYENGYRLLHWRFDPSRGEAMR